MIMMDVQDIAFLPPGDAVPAIRPSDDEFGRHCKFQFIGLVCLTKSPVIDEKGRCETMNQKV